MNTLSQNVRELVSRDLAELSLDISGHYLLIDIGTYLTNRKFSRGLESVLQRANEMGVNKIFVTGTTINSSKEALRLSRLYPGIIYCTAGVHPHDAKQWTDNSEEQLKELASNTECVAIGECGLDYNREFSPREIQREVFIKQIQIASELMSKGINRPLFLHERDAHDDFVEILTKYKNCLPNVVVHCFTGSQQEALRYLDMGFYLGLTGYISKLEPENGLMQLFEQKRFPLDKLMLESDSPYCFPNVRSNKLPQKIKDALTEKSLSYLNRYSTFQRNEPSSLPITLEIIAAYLEKKPEDVALQTTLNALKFFGISC